jgi:hypothetical protein
VGAARGVAAPDLLKRIARPEAALQNAVSAVLFQKQEWHLDYDRKMRKDDRYSIVWNLSELGAAPLAMWLDVHEGGFLGQVVG